MSRQKLKIFNQMKFPPQKDAGKLTSKEFYDFNSLALIGVC